MSLLDGVPSVREIVAFAQALSLPPAALTDSNALYGAMEFASECRQAGIASILGAELTLARGLAIVFLAQNMQGYGNLCRLITRLQAAPDREAALARGLSLNDLARHADGLIALSGGRCGPLDACLREGNPAQAESITQELVGLFGQNQFFAELQIIEEGDEQKARVLQSLADRLNVRTVATHDIHYLLPADAQLYRVLTAMRKNSRLADLPTLPDLSFPSENEMRRKFAEFPAALDHTDWIANQCRFEFPSASGAFHRLTCRRAARRVKRCGHSLWPAHHSDTVR